MTHAFNHNLRYLYSRSVSSIFSRELLRKCICLSPRTDMNDAHALFPACMTSGPNSRKAETWASSKFPPTTASSTILSDRLQRLGRRQGVSWYPVALLSKEINRI